MRAPKHSIENLKALHLEHVAATCTEHTLVAYEKAWRRYLAPGLGADADVASVTRATVRRLHAKHADTPAAANQAIAVLRSAYFLAEDEGWVDPGVNPAKRIRKHPEQRQQRPLDPEETRALFDACVDVLAGRSRLLQRPMAAAFLLVLGTGCRRTEALWVRAEDLRPDDGEVVFRRHKTVRRSGPRTSALGPDTAAMMAAWLSERDGPTSEWAFPSPVTGRPYREVNRAWSRMCAHLGVIDATPRDARTGLATTALEDGEELRAIQHQLGHASISTTARYARVTRARARATAHRMERASLRAAGWHRVQPVAHMKRTPPESVAPNGPEAPADG